MNQTDYTLSRPVCLSLPAEEIDRLLAERDGRCALVYLALQRTGGRALEPGALGLTEADLRETLRKLEHLGLVSAGQSRAPLPPAAELPQYTAEDLVRRTREDQTFRGVMQHTEQYFGRKLTTPETRMLLGMQDYLGLPADVLMELVTFVFDDFRAEKGPGRNPTMRMIEKEAHVWAQKELFTPELAEAHILRRQQRRAKTAELLEVLDIHGRGPSPSERNYLNARLDMGFGPDAVAEAYDRTVVSAGGLKWAYLNKILLNWDQKGLHALPQILEGDPRGGQRKATPKDTGAPQDDLERAERLFGLRNSRKE